jgi:hypothetical protein
MTPTSFPNNPIRADILHQLLAILEEVGPWVIAVFGNRVSQFLYRICPLGLLLKLEIRGKVKSRQLLSV